MFAKKYSIEARISRGRVSAFGSVNVVSLYLFTTTEICNTGTAAESILVPITVTSVPPLNNAHVKIIQFINDDY